MAPVAGRLLGPQAQAVVAALEALGKSDRYRPGPVGFVEDIKRLTSMADADLNPAIESLLHLAVLKRVGDALLTVVKYTDREIQDLTQAVPPPLSDRQDRTPALQAQ